MVEEGAETGNVFVSNLGIRTRAAKVLIPPQGNPMKNSETDNLPATFWITNPNNSYINNAGQCGWFLPLNQTKE